ncbi:cytochrome b, partial [Cereibacter changlensis]
MPLSNTSRSYGGVARTLHWLTALLILTAIPLGWIANRLPYDTAEALAEKAQLFSLHKSLGVAAFAVALARILWALGQPRPAPLHPERRLETALAETVHWLLYLSLLLVPLAGWVHHAATTGFAPILWPFGQDLPFVPKSETVAGIAAAAHWLFARLLILSLVLHIAGALKHHLIDRDSVLRRMTRGEAAPEGP